MGARSSMAETGVFLPVPVPTDMDKMLEEEIIGGTAEMDGQLHVFDQIHTGPNWMLQDPSPDVGGNPWRYSRRMAAFLSQISAWSYSDKFTFKHMLSGMTLQHDHLVLAEASYYEINVRNKALLVDSTAQVVITADKKVAIISFRGTDPFNPINYLTDATTKKVPYLTFHVHRGFKLNFVATWKGADGIEALLHSEICNELQAIYITGHSLGGASAVLAGLTLAKQQQDNANNLWSKVRGIYTYGQPMVIDNHQRDELQALIGSQVYRHIYYNDIVPHLPPLDVGAFDHVGFEYKYHPRYGWKLRKVWPINLFKPRATQVFSFVMTLPFLGYDILWDNIQWHLPCSKSPWSLSDHNPAGYMDSWSTD